MSMSTLIRNKIMINFIHFHDLRKALEWYTEVLGIGVRVNGIEHGFLELEMDGTDLTLLQAVDPNLTRSSYSVFTFESDNVLQAREDLVAKGVEVREIEDFGEIIGCNFRDCEGNVLMVCGPKPEGYVRESK